MHPKKPLWRRCIKTASQSRVHKFALWERKRGNDAGNDKNTGQRRNLLEVDGIQPKEQGNVSSNNDEDKSFQRRPGRVRRILVKSKRDRKASNSNAMEDEFAFSDSSASDEDVLGENGLARVGALFRSIHPLRLNGKGALLGHGTYGDVHMALNQITGELFCVKSIRIASESARGRMQQSV